MNLLSTSGVALAGVITFTVTMLGIRPAIKVAERLTLVDSPDGNRKHQPRAVPIAGGALIFAMVLVTTGVGTVLVSNSSKTPELWASIMIPSSIIFVVGLYDDFFTASPQSRLIIQTLGAFLSSILILNSRTHIQLLDVAIANYVIGIIWIVTLTNAFNFIDNMDGHSLTIAIVVSFGFGIIALSNQQYEIAAMYAVVSGAASALLKWNWEPARIYLGDSGSLFLGFLLSTLALRIQLREQQEWISVFIPVIIMTVPILDILVAVTGRLGRRISPLVAGRDHLSHRIVYIGLTVKQTVFTLAVVSTMMAVFAYILTDASTTVGAVVIPMYIVLFVATLILFLVKTKPL